MPMTAKILNYAHDVLVPLYDEPQKARILPVNLQPSTTYPAGQVLAQITDAANDVQTLTITGSPGGGTFTLTGINPVTGLDVTTAAIAYDASTSTLQTALRLAANFGAGNVTVTGSAGAWVLTFGGQAASIPVPLVALGTNAMSGGSSPTLTPVHTTVGRTAGTFANDDSAVVAVPAAPSVSGTGSGSGWAAGTHLVAITAVNPQGETTPSIATKITLTAAQSIRVAAQASLGASTTSINVYVDGTLVGSAAVTSGTSAQGDFDSVSLAVAGTAPRTNTAYTAAAGAGAQTARCILKYSCKTDAGGNVAFSSTQSTGQWYDAYPANQAYFQGCFDTARLTGLDAKAVADLGRLWYGTTSAGCLSLN